MIKLSDIQKLDKLSYAEVEKIIEEYDDIRMFVTQQLNNGKNFEELLMEAAESAKSFSDSYKNDEKYKTYYEFSSASKIFYVVEQMKAEKAGVKNV